MQECRHEHGSALRSEQSSAVLFCWKLKMVGNSCRDIMSRKESCFLSMWNCSISIQMCVELVCLRLESSLHSGAVGIQLWRYPPFRVGVLASRIVVAFRCSGHPAMVNAIHLSELNFTQGRTGYLISNGLGRTPV